LLAAVACAMAIASSLAALPADRAIAQYVRRSWTVEQGLPHGTVRGFAQSADGYLWLATYEGLVRFNGESFRLFDKSSSPGLRNNSVRTVLESRGGTLWVGTVAGLARFDGAVIETVATKEELGHDIVNAILESDDGTLWVGTEGGGVSSVRDGKIERLNVALPGDQINALAVNGDVLWIGTTRGLARVRGGAVDAFTTANGLASATILSLYTDPEGRVYAGTAAGLDLIAGDTVAHIAGVPTDQVTALGGDHDGNVWIGTYSNGLYRLNGGRIASFGIKDGLLNPTVRSIFEDDEGSVWVGTNRGFEQLRAGTFVNWSVLDGLGDEFTRAVFEDRDGVMWVGTANGLSRWENDRWVKSRDPRLASAYVLSIAQSRDGAHWFGTSNGLYRVSASGTRVITTDDGLSNPTIRAVRQDGRGDVWVATDAGINRVRPDGTVENFTGRDGLEADYALAIAETPDGRIWFATGAGLATFDGRAFTIHSAPRDLPTNRLFTLAAEDGTIWIGTDGDGLIRYRDDGWSVITSRQGLPADKILSMVDDGRGNLWLGTVRGAARAAKHDLNAVADGTASQLTARLFDESDGLGSRQCNGSGEPSAFCSRDGRIWFATANGLSALVPDHGKPPPLPNRKPIIERVLVDGKVASGAMLHPLTPGSERIEFGFTGVTYVAPDRLRFRYRLEGYDRRWIDAGESRVAAYTNLPAGDFRLVLESSRDGVDWERATLPFSHAPFFYETKTFIVVSVAMVVALLFGVHVLRLQLTRNRAKLLAELVDQRTEQIREEKARTEVALKEAEAARREAERHERMTEQALAEAEEANRAKSVFLATTSHELRTPLNAIIGFSGILIDKAKDEIDLNPRHLHFLENIRASGEYLLEIINNILDLSKIEAGRMEVSVEAVSLAQVVRAIGTVMKGVTSNRGITFDYAIPPDLPTLEADPTQLKQILYNLMANAVKFSPDGATVTIAARSLPASESPIGEDAIEVRVIDEGIGVSPEDRQVIFQEFRQGRGLGGRRPEGTGLGLALVRRFVEVHRGMVRIESERKTGSTFVVVLPCRHDAEATPEATSEA